VSFSQVTEVPTGLASFALAVDETGRVAIPLDRRFNSPGGQTIYVGYPGRNFLGIELPPGYQAAVRGIAFVGGDLICGSNGDMNSPLFKIVDWQSAERQFVDLSPFVGSGMFEVSDLDARGNLIAVGTTEEGVYVSTDSGNTWSEWNGGLPSLRIEDVTFADSPVRSLWVATLGRGAFVREFDIGVPVLVSGLRVEPVADGVRVRLSVHHPTRLRIWREQGNRTVLFTGDAGDDLELLDVRPSPGFGPLVYGVEIWSGAGWVEVERVERSIEELIPPRASRLFAASPNPFNPQTSIRFELAEAGRVTLDVFDARGRQVRKLIDRELFAGPHVKSFDGRDDRGVGLASGVYYLLLRAPDRELRGRITLVR
jgi:hypothetical protein